MHKLGIRGIRAISMIILMMMVSVIASAATIELGGGSTDASKITGRDSKIAWHLSQAYQMTVSVEHVSYLYNRNFDYGEIGIIYGFINRTNKTVREIVDLRDQENLGWNQIAQRLGVPLPEITAITAKVLDKANMADEVQLMQNLLETENKAAQNGEKTQSAAKTKQTDRSVSPEIVHKPVYRSTGKSTF